MTFDLVIRGGTIVDGTGAPPTHGDVAIDADGRIVIDREGLSMPAPEMAFDLPAGAKRLIQRVRGCGATIKSGAVVRLDDEPTGERPGRLLRGPQPASSR